MDTDKSGKVDFMEFCAFLGRCADELEVAKQSGDGAKYEKVARRLSALSQRSMKVEEEE